MQKMGDENQNPRVMNGVIITVYVDHQTTKARSLQTRRKNERERFVDRRLKREIGTTTRGYDRRADLLACIRQMRTESFARDSERDGGESDNRPERPNPKKKKRRWIRKMFSKFRLPFRRKIRRWRYCKFDSDEAEREANYNSNLWSKLTHMVGRLSRGCLRRSRRRDS